MAIIEYDKSPNITPEQRLKSLADSVRRAFEDLENNGGSKGSDVLKLGAVASENIVPIKKGGTDANTAAEARQNINFIGVNPIASVEEDTTANWAAFGTGVAYISGDDKVSNQPYTYGFIENHVYNSIVRQIWYSQSTGGSMWIRAGIASGWYTDWIKIHSDETPQYIKIYKTSDTTDYDTAYNYFDPLYGGVTVGISRGNLTAGTYNFNTYGDMSNYTARGIYIGTGIRTVRISYSVRMTNQSETRTVLSVTLYRLRNGTSTKISLSRFTQSYGAVVLSSSSITTVQEGDFIFLQAYKGYDLDVDVIGGNDTQMVIEAIR